MNFPGSEMAATLSGMIKDFAERRDRAMKFWFLKPRCEDSPWPDDCTRAAVVVAQDEEQAREVAAEAGGTVWFDKYHAECEVIYADEFDVPCLVLDQPPWGIDQFDESD